MQWPEKEDKQALLLPARTHMFLVPSISFFFSLPLLFLLFIESFSLRCSTTAAEEAEEDEE